MSTRQPARFEIYELVRVESDDSAKSSFVGKLGEIEFRRYFDEQGWCYTVKILEENSGSITTSRKLWDFLEQELRSTGEMGKRYWLQRTYSSTFSEYEKVVVLPVNPQKGNLHGELGYVCGRSQDDTGNWHYAVCLYRDQLVYGMEEQELATSGDFESEEETMASSSEIHVRVNESGEGEIVDIGKEGGRASRE